MATTRLNAIDQALDIAGSLSQSDGMTLAEEPGALGAPVSPANTGTTSVTLGAPASGIQAVSGMTAGLFTANSVGNFLTLSGSGLSAGNVGTFLITAYTSGTAVSVLNPLGVAEGPIATVTWTERFPYSLLDDLNYARTDRRLIKGTTNFYDAVPTYIRPSATGTSVPKNLTNLLSLDSKAILEPRAFLALAITNGTASKLVASGTFSWATAANRLGLPATPAAETDTARIVRIFNPANGAEMEVQTAGAHKGERIFGMWDSTAGGVDGTSCQLVFYSCPNGLDPSTPANRTAYSWEAALGVNTVELSYGFRVLMSNMTDSALMVVETVGMGVDADIAQDIRDIQSTVGESDGATSLAGLLTPTTANYPFFNLGTATPSVVTALNTLNVQIGDRTYPGPQTIITSGDPIATSLLNLANALTSATAIRWIDRAPLGYAANTAVLLPGGQTYVADVGNNGKGLMVWTRGVLRDPGTVANGDDYLETNATHVTFYSKINKGDHINYLVL